MKLSGGLNDITSSLRFHGNTVVDFVRRLLRLHLFVLVRRLGCFLRLGGRGLGGRGLGCGFGLAQNRRAKDGDCLSALGDLLGQQHWVLIRLGGRLQLLLLRKPVESVLALPDHLLDVFFRNVGDIWATRHCDGIIAELPEGGAGGRPRIGLPSPGLDRLAQGLNLLQLGDVDTFLHVLAFVVQPVLGSFQGSRDVRFLLWVNKVGQGVVHLVAEIVDVRFDSILRVGSILLDLRLKRHLAFELKQLLNCLICQLGSVDGRKVDGLLRGLDLRLWRLRLGLRGRNTVSITSLPVGGRSCVRHRLVAVRSGVLLFSRFSDGHRDLGLLDRANRLHGHHAVLSQHDLDLELRLAVL
mmetsp:Transcript_14409/g.41153  ORF Transcript_14409/g.41153 Transcript_14409/m.41153 type:complete len:354 (+) Transcript_14409:978-2039(+)